ncbi:MAG: L-arabinose isomerase, partial [uncultured Friedmanniella sp.]
GRRHHPTRLRQRAPLEPGLPPPGPRLL